MTGKQKADLLQGTLDLLILKALSLGLSGAYLRTTAAPAFTNSHLLAANS